MSDWRIADGIKEPWAWNQDDDLTKAPPSRRASIGLLKPTCKGRDASISILWILPHQFCTRNDAYKCVQTALMSPEDATKLRISYKPPPLITVWLEVRVLPGPPHNKIKHLARLLAAVATVIGDSSSWGGCAAATPNFVSAFGGIAHIAGRAAAPSRTRMDPLRHWPGRSIAFG